MKDINIGKIYAFDIDSVLSNIHLGTYTVEVLSLKNRYGESPLAKCRSIETNEELCCDVAWLTDIETCYDIYDKMTNFKIDENEDEYTRIKRIKKIAKLEKIINKPFLTLSEIDNKIIEIFISSENLKIS